MQPKYTEQLISFNPQIWTKNLKIKTCYHLAVAYVSLPLFILHKDHQSKACSLLVQHRQGVRGKFWSSRIRVKRIVNHEMIPVLVQNIRITTCHQSFIYYSKTYSWFTIMMGQSIMLSIPSRGILSLAIFQFLDLIGFEFAEQGSLFVFLPSCFKFRFAVAGCCFRNSFMYFAFNVKSYGTIIGLVVPIDFSVMKSCYTISRSSY